MMLALARCATVCNAGNALSLHDDGPVTTDVVGSGERGIMG
jgi:hypothetical protein